MAIQLKQSVEPKSVANSHPLSLMKTIKHFGFEWRKSGRG